MISTVASQGLAAAVTVGALYAGAAVLCEVNTIEDIRTSISASSGETPILLFIAGMAGYSAREVGPPLVVVPMAALGGLFFTGGIIAAWEYGGGYLRLHNHMCLTVRCRQARVDSLCQVDLIHRLLYRTSHHSYDVARNQSHCS